MTTTTIQKWGNSYAVRLPKAAVTKLRLQAGRTVRIEETTNGKGLSLTPVADSSMSLKEMVARITPENCHTVVSWGESVGKEVW